MDVVKAMYETGKDYDYAKAEFVPKAGGFTQIVWKVPLLH